MQHLGVYDMINHENIYHAWNTRVGNIHNVMYQIASPTTFAPNVTCNILGSIIWYIMKTYVMHEIPGLDTYAMQCNVSLQHWCCCIILNSSDVRPVSGWRRMSEADPVSNIIIGSGLLKATLSLVNEVSDVKIPRPPKISSMGRWGTGAGDVSGCIFLRLKQLMIGNLRRRTIREIFLVNFHVILVVITTKNHMTSLIPAWDLRGFLRSTGLVSAETNLGRKTREGGDGLQCYDLLDQWTTHLSILSILLLLWSS